MKKQKYRSGSKLVAFSINMDLEMCMEMAFPQDGYTPEEKIRALNGKPELDRCIKDVFAPVNFIGRFSELDSFIADFNQYLCFDGWNVIRKGREITFSKATGVDIDKEKEKERIVNNTEVDFLNAEFADISIENLPIDNYVLPYIEARISEIKTCLSAKLLYQ